MITPSTIWLPFFYYFLFGGKLIFLSPFSLLLGRTFFVILPCEIKHEGEPKKFFGVTLFFNIAPYAENIKLAYEVAKKGSCNI